MVIDPESVSVTVDAHTHETTLSSGVVREFFRSFQDSRVVYFLMNRT